MGEFLLLNISLNRIFFASLDKDGEGNTCRRQ